MICPHRAGSFGAGTTGGISGTLRLDGWKSIAAYFGRERTTVIRWSTERGMPVHRIPGSARGSVYALTEELDAWLARPDGDDISDAGVAPPIAATKATTHPSSSWRAVSLAVLVAAAGIGLAVYAWPEPPSTTSIPMPQNDQAAALYVEARAAWARRTPAALTDAIAKLERVVAMEPQFAPAYSALADCYLLAREFGSLRDVEAFGRAQAAVDTALKINPSHGGALRARGFLDYWWHGDRNAASRSFRQSLAVDGKSAQTLFWFANALIDNGDFKEGLQRFTEAQLVEPASPSIAADLAWARWSTGDAAAAKAALLELRRSDANLATIADYLSVIALASGDVEGFVAEVEAMARLRKETALTAYAADLRAALPAGSQAVSDRIVAHAETEVTSGDRRTLVWPAFAASATGDRATLIRLLRKAEARSEVWGSAGLRRHIAGRWQRDTEVANLLKRRAPPSLGATER
ncbi:MAG: tetratricopeptide repeat protein [Sphingopyxis sp.]|uniref:tetratricopeptide repeat protein n=1 Tax=Sphingopyxis sp. TaxID=1908224 RepID=UPI0032ED1222